MDSQIKEFFRHVDYIALSPKWQQIDVFMRGDERYLKSFNYLWPHASEQANRHPTTREQNAAKENRQLREMRTEYKNYLKMIQNRFVSLIFKGGLEYSQLEGLLGVLGAEVIKDIDGEGNNISMFGQLLLKDLLAYGYSYVIPDKVTSNASTLAQQVETKDRSYLRRLEPLSVPDWQRDSQGQFEAFRYEYQVLKPRVDLSAEPFLGRYCMVGTFNKQSKVYTASLYASSDEKNNLINYHPQAKKIEPHHSWMLQGDPIELLEQESMPLTACTVGDSWLSDLVPIIRKIYNKESDLDNIVYSQGYDKVFIAADFDGALNAEGKPLADNEAEATIGYSTITIIPKDATIHKIEPTVPTAITESLAVDMLDLFRVAFNLTRSVSADSKAPESAETRKEAKEELLTRIENKRTEFLALYSEALKKLIKHQTGNDAPKDFQLEFKAKADAQDIQELAGFINTIRDTILNYPKWRQAAHKKLAQGMGFANEKEIIDEIDDTVIKSPVEEQNNAKATAQNKLKAVIDG